MRKILTALSFVLFAMMFLPVSTYAATTHKHVKHVVHKVKQTRYVKKVTHKTKKRQVKKQQTKKQYGNGTVQGTSPYVIVGTMEPTKQFTWDDLMKQGPNWLNYAMANSRTTWNDPAKY